MDGLPSLGQTLELLHSLFLVTSKSNCSLYVKLKLFWLCRTKIVLVTSNTNCSCYFQLKLFLFIELNSSAQLHQRVSSTLSASELNFSAQLWRWVNSTPSASQLNSAASLLNSAVSLLNSVSRSFHFCILCEESRQWVLSFCIPHEEFRYFLLCTLFKKVLYPVSRVYATLSTLDSVFLCNSEILYRVVILGLYTE